MALGPVQAFTGSNTKLRWTDLYASDSINKAFLGMPKGVYLGFTPIITGLVLDLNRDTALVYSGLFGTFAVGTTITGGASGATAVIRFIHSGLPLDGFLNIDTIVGTFIEGETFNGPGVSATLEQITFDDISVAKVASTSSFAGNRTEEAITVVIESDISLDFSPGTITDGTYFVILTASYEVGQESSALVSSRKDDPADGRLEIGICAVTKFGGALTLEPITTTNRADPYADNTTRIGLMPAGAVDDLAGALQTVREVVASRTGYDGISLGEFDPGQPKTTGLPGRIGSDLERTNMGARLGKDSLVVQGNDYTLQSTPSGNTLNISGSFAAKTRDVQPFRDVTNNDIPLGLTVPILLRPDGIDGQTLTIAGAVGAFAVGNKIEGTGGGSAIIRGVFSSVP